MINIDSIVSAVIGVMRNQEHLNWNELTPDDVSGLFQSLRDVVGNDIRNQRAALFPMNSDSDMPTAYRNLLSTMRILGRFSDIRIEFYDGQWSVSIMANGTPFPIDITQEIPINVTSTHTHLPMAIHTACEDAVSQYSKI